MVTASTDEDEATDGDDHDFVAGAAYGHLGRDGDEIFLIFTSQKLPAFILPKGLSPLTALCCSSTTSVLEIRSVWPSKLVSEPAK